ncbi:MAG: phospholipase D family protein [Phototrophicaceae bacterium]
MSKTKKTSQYSDSLFIETEPLLKVVKAEFIEQTDASFESLIKGYETLRVLTYSNSVSLVRRVVKLVDDLEIIFGREDIVNKMAEYLTFQHLLLLDIKQEFKEDIIREKIDAGKVRLFVVRNLISHEKLYLLEGSKGRRVITGSANFSEKAVSGSQNESFLYFDNDDLAWEYFDNKYKSIKDSSTQEISKRAIIDENFDVEQIPILDNQSNSSQIIIIDDRTSKPPSIIEKIFQPKIPKQYINISSILTPDKNVVRMDRQAKAKAVQYVKSSSRSKSENPDEYLSINLDRKQITLSKKELDLNPPEDHIRRDIGLMLEYFEGYKDFRGNTEKLAQDYFTFMSWLYISPFICDFRRRAESSLDDDIEKFDYPVFGLLYGKSNCGKSELVKWLLLSMFQREGFLPNDWFTKSRVPDLRTQNGRYPMVFDDMDKKRFSDHAIPMIKEDYINLPEYPVIVLSMNADKDTFESEVRKRCLIIYTGASLPDHTGEARKLGIKLKKLKKEIGDAFYRAYLGRVMEKLEPKPPADILSFSSEIIHDLFIEYSEGELPEWCQPVSMGRYVQTKHDKVKEELLSHIRHSPASWRQNGTHAILDLQDVQQRKKLQQDVPDYLIANTSTSKIIFYKEELELFLGEPIRPQKQNWLSKFFQ